MTEFQSLIDAAHEMTAKHGTNIKGKRYLSVAHRIELFRRHYGDKGRIATEVLHLGVTRGEPVCIRASITVGRGVVATGTASEVIGDGNINRNSALENAETSAVGRALAVLGLHGGEMVSMDEVKNATDGKPDNPPPSSDESEPPPSPAIPEDQWRELEDLIEKAGVDTAVICKAENIVQLEDLPPARLETVKKRLRITIANRAGGEANGTA